LGRAGTSGRSECDWSRLSRGGLRWFAMAAWMLVSLAVAISAQPIVAGFERFYAEARDEAQLVAGGLLLLNELNCVACHAPPEAWRGQLLGRGRISLTEIGSRLDVAS